MVKPKCTKQDSGSTPDRSIVINAVYYGEKTEMSDRDEKGRFVPGNPGGPGRPPKGDSITDALSREISEEEIAKILAQMIRDGNFAAVRYASDRIGGKPVETVMQHISGAPEVIEVVHGEDSTDTEDNDAVEE